MGGSASGEFSGECVDHAPPGKCWSDGDCSGGKSCQGVIWCPCGALCFAPTTPGTCVDDDPCAGMAIQGCSEDSQCPDNAYCAINGGCNPSTCFCDPETGMGGCTDDCQPGLCQPLDD